MRYKSIRKRIRRKKPEALDVDITSLLDILVILLVFLLKSYNSSGVIFNVPKGIKLPFSVTKQLNTPGVIVQVSESKIWVDDQVILDVTKPGNRIIYDQGGSRIISLYNELRKKRALYKQVEKTAKGAKRFSGIVNLVVDKGLKYSYVKKILATCADAGFQKYKFVVSSTE
tara:strand:- start:4340 stop:4852 length:513 start_codon:yes stop_codon:yes gene_type:complete